MGNLFTPRFWFNYYYLPLVPWFKIFLVAFTLALVILAVIMFIYKRRKDSFAPLRANFYNFFLTNAIVGLFICFFNYEEVPFLGARFWILFWAIEILVWLWFLFKQFRRLPQLRQKQEEQKKFRKYLPK